MDGGGTLIAGSTAPMDRDPAQALAIDLARASTPTQGGQDGYTGRPDELDPYLARGKHLHMGLLTVLPDTNRLAPPDEPRPLGRRVGGESPSACVGASRDDRRGDGLVRRQLRRGP